MNKIIDAHIHLDHYKKNEINKIVKYLEQNKTIAISVSFHLNSCRKNLDLANQSNTIKPAFGYHPEQSLPNEKELIELLEWMELHHQQMVAIGEIGLPYYLKQQQHINVEAYIELLEQFLMFAKRWEKPVVLHAVYEDAPIVCNLLEKHSIKQAHFHWFKGDVKTMERMAKNGYHISITPDVLYEKEIQEIVKKYPLNQIMVETDGPWPFEGPFKGHLTHPNMIHQSIQTIAHLQNVSISLVYQQLYKNTLQFYKL